VAYRSSIKLAEERGTFPIFDAKREANSPFILRIKEECPELYDEMIKHGRRNIALLTIAPTGTVSIMTQTTSGIEPAFEVFYKRRRKINPQEKDTRIDFVDEEGIAWQEYPVFHHKFKTWLEVNGYNIDDVKLMKIEQLDEIVKKSPYYKATANDVDWIKKVEMQGKLQKHIDHSISVTVNLPKDVTEDLVSKVYETGWRSGCKGITVYRDGSRSGVLVNTEKKEEQMSENHVPKRPKKLKAEIHRFQNNLEKWIAVVGLKDGRPYEIFTGKLENGLAYLPPTIKECDVIKNVFEIEEVNDEGKLVKIRKKRYDIEYIDVNGDKQVHTGLNHTFNPEYWNYAKFISAVLRHRMPLVSVHQLIESLNFREDHINVWKNGVARVIKKYIKDGEKGQGVCPECGSTHLEYKEGCLTCMSCGNSKCG
jgi:ribonucleoside-diphosphate reductase alpha chain